LVGGLAIGIDIGGTKIAGALVTASGQIKTRIRCQTVASEGGHAVMERAIRLVEELLVSSSQKVEGIGIASAGFIDPKTGVVLHATDLLPGWTGTELARTFENRFSLPAMAINDACAAAVGENRFGAAQGLSDFVLLTLGTGVGGGIFCGGRLLLGALGVAGSVGHMIIDCNGRQCSCGSKGCLEAYVSGTAVANRALELGSERCLDSPLLQAIRTNRSEGAKLISIAASEGDPFAVEVLHEAGTYLGWGLTSLFNLFNPAKIVLGGSVAEAGDFLLKPARDVVSQSSLRGEKDSACIVKAQLGDDAGIIGAASLVWDPIV
jgi:glucokinase